MQLDEASLLYWVYFICLCLRMLLIFVYISISFSLDLQLNMYFVECKYYVASHTILGADDTKTTLCTCPWESYCLIEKDNI